MVVTGRSRKAFAGNRTWVRIPPFPPIIKMDLQKEVHFNILKVGFERRAFPERIARKKKCEGRTIGPHLFRLFNKIGFVAEHFLKRQRGKRNAKAGRLDNHLFCSSGGILSADCCSQSNFALLVLLYNKLR